ncbi:MAG: threonine ammonia-lyase [Planctomycetaceae bacterium]|nr:threonine ammonia-lyase [Planctomycetaceae bacterium]
MTATAIDVHCDDVVAAMARIADGVVRTPCHESDALSELCGARIFTKAEYLQRTGSFKERGARNALLQMDPALRARGVVAASAGNHALALAYHGRDLGISVTVVMPRGAPLVKQVRCAHYGARVLLHGDTIADAKVKADELAQSQGLTYVHGFNDAAIIAGAGTVGIEILEQVPDVEAIVTPVGGGGLIAGVALAVKELRPNVQIVGVEPERCPSLIRAIEQGRPVPAFDGPTLADGLAVPQVGDRAFAIARDRVDALVTVSEADISLAILRLVELEKGVVEGAGAVPLAAFLAGKLQALRGKRVALLLCGGNIDPMVLSRVIEHGVAVDGRLTEFTAVISDRPGGLAELASTIASTGASVQQIDHERAFGEADVSRVTVRCRVEVRDGTHLETLKSALKSKGIQVH